MAVEGKVLTIYEKPVKVVLSDVLFCICDQPGPYMMVLQPVHDGHVKSCVPCTLTAGAPTDAAMSHSHKGVQPKVRLHLLHFGTPQLHQVVAVPYCKDFQSLEEQEVHRNSKGAMISKTPQIM